MGDSLKAADSCCTDTTPRSDRTWTKCIPTTEHNSLFLSCDYSTTALGPISAWGSALRLYAAMVFADSRGACVFWGPSHIAFYNEKYSVYCGEKHPSLMGSGILDAFPSLREELGSILDQAIATEQTVDVDNILLFPVRNGYPEESYFVGQFIPIRGDSGEVEGFYHTVFETTTKVLQHRRRAVVDRIAAVPPHDVEQTLSLILDCMRINPHDITMAMIYSYDDLATGGDATLHLRGSIGVPHGHISAPATARLDIDHTGLLPIFRKAMLLGSPQLISNAAEKEVFEGITWCGYGERSSEVAVLCLRSGTTVLGFYVQGINPHRRYDDDYERSLVDLARQIEGKWMSSDSFQQAKLREQALEDRATDSENRLRQMARSAPLGMCQITPDHKLQWANDQYYEITGHDRSNPDISAFHELVAAEEWPVALEGLQSLLKGESRRVREIRMNREWTPPVRSDEETEKNYVWVLTSSFPLFEDGKVKLVMGYVSDISHQKWAESVQTRNARAALLAKRRQEEFIDTTSHEMRNPLSAITQLADGIARSMPEHNSEESGMYHQIVLGNIESANTILACAAHQKRVIDDVLILSRLESQMLSIAPVADQIDMVLSNTIKMLAGEVAMHGTEIEASREESISNLPISYLLIDTQRLVQVLLNLISNAIKFTSTQSVRKVAVRYGVQASRPRTQKTSFGDLEWKEPVISGRANEVLPPPSVDQERLYLYITVQDTGPGLTEEEMKRLFQRFAQASSKTHTTYGGNGIGLYICRELAEKQGGSVGVASHYGDGSVFGFYIETRAAQVTNGSLEGERSQNLHVDTDMPNSQVHETLKNVGAALSAGSGTTELTSPQPEEGSSRKSYHVLLVEDNLVNQKVLAKQLRNARCTVAVANHGKEALEILTNAGHWPKQVANSTTSESMRTAGGVNDSTTERIDVVLMDWEMPVMNGLDCCKEIRTREESGGLGNTHLPVIAITANVRQEQKDHAIAAGMDDVLTKPFSVTDLLNKIEEVLAMTTRG